MYLVSFEDTPTYPENLHSRVHQSLRRRENGGCGDRSVQHLLSRIKPNSINLVNLSEKEQFLGHGNEGAQEPANAINGDP